MFKKIFYTILLLGVLGGGAYGYLRFKEPIDRLLNPGQRLEALTGGVVVLTNNYYYRLQMPDGQTLYFSGVGADAFENLTFSKDSIVMQTITGVAAAVSDSGLFVTTRSVAMPQLATAGEKPMKVQDLIDRLSTWIETEQRGRAGAYRALEDSINDNYYIDKNDSIVERVQGLEERIKQRQRDLMADIRGAREALARLKALDPAQVKFDCVSHVTARLVNTALDPTGADTIPCTVIDDGKGLPLVKVKLKSGITPASVPVFDLPGGGLLDIGGNDSVALAVGDKVHLLSTVRSNDSYRTQRVDAHVVQRVGNKLLVDVGSGHSVADLLGSPVYTPDGVLVAVCAEPMKDAVNFFHCIISNQ